MKQVKIRPTAKHLLSLLLVLAFTISFFPAQWLPKVSAASAKGSVSVTGATFNGSKVTLSGQITANGGGYPCQTGFKISNGTSTYFVFPTYSLSVLTTFNGKTQYKYNVDGLGGVVSATNWNTSTFSTLNGAYFYYTLGSNYHIPFVYDRPYDFINSGSFSISFTMPSGATTGTYRVTGFLCDDYGASDFTSSYTFSLKKDISSGSVAFSSTPTYTGQAYTVKSYISSVKASDGTTLGGNDYDLSPLTISKPGGTTVTITAKSSSDFSGSITKTFTINKANLSSATASNVSSATYDGTAKTPTATLSYSSHGTLSSSSDYSISDTFINAGTYAFTANAKGSYFTGSKSLSGFVINKRNIGEADITVEDAVYDGTTQRPNVSATYNGRNLTEGTDYTLGWGSNTTNAGQGTVTLTGKGNFQSNTSKNFNISQANLSDADITGVVDKPYTGNEINQSLVVKYNGKTLNNPSDYTVIYDTQHTNVGTVKGHIEAAPNKNFKGEQTFSFEITSLDADKVKVGPSAIPTQTYTGGAIEPHKTIENFAVLFNNLPVQGYTVFRPLQSQLRAFCLTTCPCKGTPQNTKTTQTPG